MKYSKDEIFLTALLSLCLVAISLILIFFHYSESIIKFLIYVTEFNLNEWRSIVHIIYGALGLILGYWYFVRKIKIEDKNSKNERIRKRLMFLYNEFCKGDDIINDILDINILDDEGLKKHRARLDRLFLSINNYLDNNDVLLGFTTDEIKKLIEVHSFAINSNVIFELDHASLTKIDRTIEYIKYIDVIQEAKGICLQKEELL